MCDSRSKVYILYTYKVKEREERPVLDGLAHSVVKPRIASKSCARRFLCNFYTKITSEI